MFGVNLLPKLKSNSRFETLENFSILFIVIGALTLSLGMGLTAISTKGIPTIIAMVGSLISFISTGLLIFTWLAKENVLVSIVFGSLALSFAVCVATLGMTLVALAVGVVSALIMMGVLSGIYFLITKRFPW